MLTSTFGIIVIIIGGLVALALLEGTIMYAAAHPTWKTGPGAAGERAARPAGLGASPTAALAHAAGGTADAGPQESGTPEVGTAGVGTGASLTAGRAR